MTSTDVEKDTIEVVRTDNSLRSLKMISSSATVMFRVQESEVMFTLRSAVDMLREMLLALGSNPPKDGVWTYQGTSVPMILNCPSCHQRHIDVGHWSLHPHHTHACQHCGMVWRPAKVHTVGVQFLPGFRDL